MMISPKKDRLYSLLILFLCVIICGCREESNSNDNAPEYGTIAFDVTWKDDGHLKKSKAEPGTNRDVCDDYGIETISAYVYNIRNHLVTSEKWPCDAHGGEIQNVPAESGLKLILEGDIDERIEWRGQLNGITVPPGDAYEAGAIEISYIGRDQTSPSVNLAYPSTETAVSPNCSVTITFSEPVSPGSITINTFYMFIDSDVVPGTVVYNETSNSATFQPDITLNYDTVYSIIATNYIEDLAGNQLSDDFIWNFRTIPEPDLTAPTITTVTPNNSDTDVPLNAFISASFNKPVDPSSLNDISFIVSPQGGSAIAGYVTYNPNTNTVLFIPNQNLNSYTHYSATISTLVTDVSGNHLERDYTWSFQTTGTRTEVLDRSFGSDGYVVFDKAAGGYEPSNDNRDYTIAMTTDDYGRILVYGISYDSNQNLISVVLRFNSDGSIDESFGSAGVCNLETTNRATCIKVHNNTIYLVGSCNNLDTGHEDLAIWRISDGGVAEGSVHGEPTFRFDTASGDEVGNDLLFDDAETMYVTGSVSMGLADDMALWKFTVSADNVVLDTTFGIDGLASHDDAAGGGTVSGTNKTDDGKYILEYNNRLWVAGNSNEGSSMDIVIWCYDKDGSLDNSFGTDGYRVIGGPNDPVDSYDVNGFAIDGMGRFVLAGRHWAPIWQLATFRLNSDGSFDTTYNNTGYNFHEAVTGLEDHCFAYDLAVDNNNNIIVVGEGPNSGSRDLLVVKYRENGELDTSFSVNGVYTFTSEIGEGSYFGRKITIDSEGNYIVAGHGFLSGGDMAKDVYLWRLFSNQP